MFMDKTAVLNQAGITTAPKFQTYPLGIRPVEVIALHQSPDLDSIAAVFLLQKHGQAAFPGIEKAKIDFWGCNGTPDGKSDIEWLIEKKTLSVDTGGSIFDEHVNGGTGRMANTCATKLVADYLGIAEMDEMKQLLKLTTTSDTKTGTSPLHLASLIKAMHNMGTDPNEVIKWANIALEAFQKAQERFWGPVRNEFFQTGKFIDALEENGRPIQIAVVQTDSPDAERFARANGAKVTVKRGSKGDTQIFTTPGIYLWRVARLIRTAELKAQGKPIPSGMNLSDGGRVPGIPEWYLAKHDESDMLLNGSLTHKDVPPTKLPLETVVALVIDGLRPPRSK